MSDGKRERQRQRDPDDIIWVPESDHLKLDALMDLSGGWANPDSLCYLFELGPCYLDS